MSRRHGVGLSLVCLLILSGCADVAASPESPSSPTTAGPTVPSPTSPPVAATPTPATSSRPTGTPTRSTPKPKPTRKATPKPPPKAKPSQKELALQVERRLESFGYPVGDVDGTLTNRSRQALCAWREATGMPVSRGRLTTADVRSVLLATRRPAPTRPDGIYVNKTCQVLFQIVGNTYRRIVWVSTGAPGYDTPNGTGKVWRKWAGAHESSLYDDAYMYDSIYFLKNRPGIALHGSRVNSLIKTYPASHSCVRVMRPAINRIFDETPLGTTVSVYGAY